MIRIAETTGRRQFLASAGTGLALVLMNGLPSWVVAGSRPTKAYRERSFSTMGSVATICVYGESTRHIDQVINKVIAEFGRLDALLSVFNPLSAISQINTMAGKSAVRIPAEVGAILRGCQEGSNTTRGAFDVTIGPLMSLWGFREKKRNVMPSDREVSRVLGAVGNHHLILDARESTAGLDHPDSRIDLGGIGVGYAVDSAIQILHTEGIQSAFLNHAGDAYALGSPEEADRWIAGIPDPSRPESMIRTYRLRNCAISTSAQYEKFVTIDSVRYGHLMDTASGYPERRSVCCTVICQTSWMADLLSTGSFCNPAIVEQFPKISYFLAESSGGETRIHEHIEEGIDIDGG